MVFEPMVFEPMVFKATPATVPVLRKLLCFETLGAVTESPRIRRSPGGIIHFGAFWQFPAKIWSKFEKIMF